LPATVDDTPLPTATAPSDAHSETTPDHPFIDGGPFWRTSSAGLLAVFTVMAVALLPVPGLYVATGGTMEEGFMLYFPELLKRGEVPNVDFLHLYGPGSLHLLAGWYEIFGATLVVERTFGLLQNLGIIIGLYAIGRMWGRGVAAGTGVVAAVIIMTPIGLQAMAWHGALAFGIWTVVFAVRARQLFARAAVLNWGVAGLFGGLALSFRPDIVIAVGAVLAYAGWRDRRLAWKPVACGASIGLIPMWVHLAMAGLGPSFEGMVLDPVFELRPGRELPSPPSLDKIDGSLLRVVEFFPPWWDVPALGASKQLFLWFWGMILAAVVVPVYAWWRRRKGDRRNELVVLLTAGLFAVGILGQGVQRPDSTHLAWVTIASWPLLVPLFTEIIGRWRQRARSDSIVARAGFAPTAAFGAVAVLMFVVAPFYTYRPYVLHTRVAVGALPDPYRVERNGREFYFGAPDAASTLQAAMDDLDEWSKPGEKLIVGPYDLSRTYYNESFVYWMFPELEPGTYFIEMDPGVADAEDSGLADEVAGADWILLTKYWSDWNEPNISSEHRSQAPNEVIADSFCLVGRYDGIDKPALVTLYHRCGSGNGVGISPAEVDGTTPVVGVGG
jgi:hypothetical membrane protein